MNTRPFFNAECLKFSSSVRISYKATSDYVITWTLRQCALVYCWYIRIDYRFQNWNPQGHFLKVILPSIERKVIRIRGFKCFAKFPQYLKELYWILFCQRIAGDLLIICFLAVMWKRIQWNLWVSFKPFAAYGVLSLA